MKKKSILARMLLLVAIATVLTLGMYSFAAAHCDTLDGPVIQDARKALETKDVTPVLKWVKQKDEKVVRAAYDKALSAKGKKNADAAENTVLCDPRQDPSSWRRCILYRAEAGR